MLSSLGCAVRFQLFCQVSAVWVQPPCKNSHYDFFHQLSTHTCEMLVGGHANEWFTPSMDFNHESVDPLRNHFIRDCCTSGVGVITPVFRQLTRLNI